MPDDPPNARKDMSDGSNRMVARAAGLVMLGLCALVLALSCMMYGSGWVMAATAFAPLGMGAGLGLLIEGPRVPVQQMSDAKITAVLTGVGAVVGVVGTALVLCMG